VFTPGAAGAGTLDFSLSGSSFDVTRLAAVIDISSNNAQLYLMGVTGYGASIDTTGKVLTLQQNTAGLAASDTLVMVFDEGNDNLNDLNTVLFGANDPDASYRLPSGAQVRNPVLEGLLRETNALLKVLVRMTIADKQIPDSDIESMLSEELNKSN